MNHFFIFTILVVAFIASFFIISIYVLFGGKEMPEIDELNTVINDNRSEIVELRQRIAELEHQHKNDECANNLLIGEINRVRENTIREAAALFQGEPRNREMYLNDIEELILGMLSK